MPCAEVAKNPRALALRPVTDEGLPWAAKRGGSEKLSAAPITRIPLADRGSGFGGVPSVRRATKRRPSTERTGHVYSIETGPQVMTAPKD